MPTPRQQTRELLRPLFLRPVSPEQRAVTDAVERRIAELESMLRAAGFNDAQIAAGTPYVEVMGG